MSSGNNFDLILRNTVITLRDRARHECKSEEAAQRFQEALNFIEVGGALGKTVEAITQKTTRDAFADIFVTPELVTCIRQRWVKRGLKEFRRIAKETQNEMVSAFGSLSDEMAEQIMPWSLLDKLYKEGARIDTTHKTPDRILSFNTKYEEFIANMACAFPSAESDHLADRFRQATMYEPAFVYTKYKEIARPYLQSIKNPEAARDVYDDPSVFFAKLPYIGSLPLHEYWDVQVLQNEDNRKYISETFSQLLIGLTGLPMELLGSDMITTVNNYVREQVKKKNKGGSPSLNADGSVNMSEIMGIAMSVIGDMQKNGQLDSLMSKLDGSTFDVDEEMLAEMNEHLDMGPEMNAALEALSATSAVNDEHPVFASTRGTIKEE